MLEQVPFCTLLTRGFSRKHNKICSWQYGHPSDTECLFVLATSAMEENWPSSACLICPPTSALSHANNFATVSPAVVPALPSSCGVASSRLASLCDAPFQSSCGHVLSPPLCPHTTTPLMFVKNTCSYRKKARFLPITVRRRAHAGVPSHTSHHRCSASSSPSPHCWRSRAQPCSSRRLSEVSIVPCLSAFSLLYKQAVTVCVHLSLCKVLTHTLPELVPLS